MKTPGIVKKGVRFFGYPAFAVLDQVKTSAGRINALRKLQQEARKKALEKAQLPDAQGMTPAQRFEALYERNGWTEDALRRQYAAVRMMKWAALLATVVMVPLILWTITKVSGLLLPVCLLALGLVLGFGVGKAFGLGLYQHQIETRSFAGKWEYLARKDFFRHLVLG